VPVFQAYLRVEGMAGIPALVIATARRRTIGSRPRGCGGGGKAQAS